MASNPSATGSVELWVSLDGNDGATGTREAPFRTLRRAHEALCAASATAGNIALYVGDGVHRLTEPLVFDAQRFGPGGPHVRISAAPGARPSISGGIRVEGWRLHDEALNIFKTNVGVHRSRHLYVDGRRATRARTTMSGANLPAGFRPTPIQPEDGAVCGRYVMGGGIEFIPTELNPAHWRNPAGWKNPHAIEAVVKTQWKMMSVPLREIVPVSEERPGMILLQQPGWTNANLFFGTKSGPPSIWSFWQVTYFENAYEFLDQPGEWYLDDTNGDLFYIPWPWEDLATADVELAVLEILVEACGTVDRPVTNLHFEGITFCYATWLGPGCPDGYVADQSGFRLTGDCHQPNIIGHDRHVVRTPGNLRFEYAQDIHFRNNRFHHLGAVALDFATGSQRNRIEGNRFDDISSAAIQLGGIDEVDHHPKRPGQYTTDNVILNNWITGTGREFVDSASIYIGFTRNTLVAHNTISDTPWSGIALGWGWGLYDVPSFPGVVGATSGMWGNYSTPTVNSGNRILRNHISRFIQDRWDGGAVYCNGQQGQSMDDPLLIEGNVVCHKRKEGGGNMFYTDGGSRYVVIRNNASFDNPIGHADLGPPPQTGDPLPYPAGPSALNVAPYGGEIGGCRTYGDIHFEGNYWRAGQIPAEQAALGPLYSAEGFFNICPYTSKGITYPTNLTYAGNHDIPLGEIEVPQEILRNAGIRRTPGSVWLELPGTASFPPHNPGPSWNVPRVSLPGLFGIQPQFAQEWWYYVGTAYDEAGQAFSLQIQITRVGSGLLQLGLGITGIGWREGEQSNYISGLGFGLGAGGSVLTIPSVVIPPVSDYAYSASFVPLLELVGRSPHLLDDLQLNVPSSDGWDGWKFEYLSEASDGRRVGEPGSHYAVSAHGRGYRITADSADTTKSEYRIALTVVDQRGMVMEGISGYVGPEMFARKQEGSGSYECAQPNLRIQSGGSIVINGTIHTIQAGYLWLDRQMVESGGVGVGDAPAAPQNAEDLKKHLMQTAQHPKQLYRGDWMGIVLNDNRVLVLAEFWQQTTPQWKTGTKVGTPPENGFGNFYFDSTGTNPAMNGGMGLRARTVEGGDDWDFDVNIFDAANSDASPHWQSKISGKTYATAWQIDFSPRATAYGLPPSLYVFAVSDNCEVIPTGKASAFFEGAAFVYADRERITPLGNAFVEQMGFD